MLRKVKASSLLLLFLTPFFVVVDASAAKSAAKNVCVKSDGSIFVRPKCKRKEVVLSSITLNQTIANSQDAAGPAGPVGATGVVGSKGATGATGPQGGPGAIGAKGPRGEVNFDACRLTSQSFTSNFLTPNNSVLYAEVYCGQYTEYLVEDEAVVSLFPDSTGTKVVLQGRLPYHETVGGDKREYAVGYYANRFTIVGSGVYSLSVRAFCCPR